MKPTEVQELDNAGIYVEPIGSAIIYSNQWTIAGILEIPEWDDTISQITKSKTIIKTFCEKSIIEHQHCTNWQHRLDNRIRDATDRIAHIKFFNNENQRVLKKKA